MSSSHPLLPSPESPQHTDIQQVERTNNRGDGVACFVSPRVELVDFRPILFLDCGDRVGVLCRLRIRDDEAAGKGGKDDDDDDEQDYCEVLVVNTHLRTFPNLSLHFFPLSPVLRI